MIDRNHIGKGGVLFKAVRNTMDFAELSAARYSLRQFSKQPVEEAKLELLLKAAQNAPTAKNLQPQRIFVISTEEQLAKADACMSCHYAPPMVIVVAYDPAEAWVRSIDGKNHGEIDAAIVATQIMLQAADIGLGTTYVGMFDLQKLYETFPEMNGTVPIAMLLVGYPGENAHPARLHKQKKALEETVRFL